MENKRTSKEDKCEIKGTEGCLSSKDYVRQKMACFLASGNTGKEEVRTSERWTILFFESFVSVEIQRRVAGQCTFASAFVAGEDGWMEGCDGMFEGRKEGRRGRRCDSEKVRLLMNVVRTLSVS